MLIILSIIAFMLCFIFWGKGSSVKEEMVLYVILLVMYFIVIPNSIKQLDVITLADFFDTNLTAIRSGGLVILVYPITAVTLQVNLKNILVNYSKYNNPKYAASLIASIIVSIVSVVWLVNSINVITNATEFIFVSINMLTLAIYATSIQVYLIRLKNAEVTNEKK